MLRGTGGRGEELQVPAPLPHSCPQRACSTLVSFPSWVWRIMVQLPQAYMKRNTSISTWCWSSGVFQDCRCQRFWDQSAAGSSGHQTSLVLLLSPQQHLEWLSCGHGISHGQGLWEQQGDEGWGQEKMGQNLRLWRP